MDIVRLVEIRNYDVKGYRELFCFLYRYWSCCLTHNAEDSLNQMLEFNNEFKEPLSKNEVIRATRSAEKAWMAKSDSKANEEAISKGYPGAGYNLKNTTLIKWFDITSDEQKCLRTIIDGNEKRRRKRERDMFVKREDRGSVSREKYIQEQQQKTEDKLLLLYQLLKEYPKAKKKELAQMLMVSDRHLRRLIRQI